jgi:quercetin dioxygenase-like cupin family protein
MKIVDLHSIPAYPLEEKDKNVFFEKREFKTRITELGEGGKIPQCDMTSHVIFVVIKGEAELSVNEETKTIREGEAMITEPARLSLYSEKGVRIMGIQIHPQEE